LLALYTYLNMWDLVLDHDPQVPAENKLIQNIKDLNNNNKTKNGIYSLIIYIYLPICILKTKIGTYIKNN